MRIKRHSFDAGTGKERIMYPLLRCNIFEEDRLPYIQESGC